MNPFECVGLDESDQIGNGNVSVKGYQQMNVVGHASGGDESAVFGVKDAADVLEQAELKIGAYLGRAMLRAKDQVYMKAGERLGHAQSRDFCRPIGPGFIFWPGQTRGLRPLANDYRHFGAFHNRGLSWFSPAARGLSGARRRVLDSAHGFRGWLIRAGDR